MRKLIISSLLLCLVTSAAFSQDNQYNTQQFGGRSAMLGGAVIAGAYDNSAIFYNPAALAFIKDVTLSVNANIYKISMLKISNALGENIDLKSTRISLYPGMISGLVRFKRNTRFTGSYALITRHYGNEKVQARKEFFSEIFPEFTGTEEFIGSFEYESRIFEQWGGFGVGFKATEHFSVGLTQFISYRSHVFKQSAFTRAIFSDTSNYFISSLTDQHDVVLDLVRFIWKAGIHYHKNGWKLGVNITSPSLNVLGFANVSREISAQNLIDIPNGRLIDVLALDRQKGLSARYHSPLSVAIGIEKKFAAGALMFSMEYFGKINKYQIVKPNPEPFVRPSSFDFGIDEEEFLSVIYAADPVINFALGYEHTLSEKYTLHCSVRTDFSALDEELKEGNEMIISNAFWDIYHATIGFSARKGATLTTIGFNYSLGFNKRDNNLERFDRPETIYRDAIAPPIEMRTSVHALALVVGFTYFMKRG